MSPALIRAAVLAVLLAVGACDRSPPVDRAIEPASASEVDLTLRPDGDETVAEIAVGQTLAIQLKTHFEWSEATPPERLQRLDVDWSPATTGVRDRGESGGDHWQVFVYRAIGPGGETLVFNEARPWQPEVVTDTVKVHVVVRPAG